MTVFVLEVGENFHQRLDADEITIFVVSYFPFFCNWMSRELRQCASCT